MATVTAFLQHTNVGKAKQAQPYTAAAHARYILRQGACSLSYSEHMPKQYHAVQRWLAHHEDGLRKNGRVIDKFIISVPHDISEQDAVAALRRFGVRLGKGKAPFLFALHGFDTRNHHAHFIFVDRDPETGRRVFGTSERDSSGLVKIEWETAANDTFAERGYEVRVKVHDGLAAENDNTFEMMAPESSEGNDEAAPLSTDNDLDSGSDLLESAPEADSLTTRVAEDADAGEPPMPLLVTLLSVDREEADSLAASHIRLVHSTKAELNFLWQAKSRISDLERRVASLAKQRDRAQLERDAYHGETDATLKRAYAAKENLKQHRDADSERLHGYHFKLFGFNLKTPARRRAETALSEYESLKTSADYIRQGRDEHESRISGLAQQQIDTERDLALRLRELERLYGSQRELTEAELALSDTIRRRSQDVPFDAAHDAFDAGEVTPDEYETYLIEGGHREALEAFIAAKEQSAGHEY